MEYQEIKYLLDKTRNQPSKFRTKIWVERNDNSSGTNSQIKFKHTMLKSSLWHYSDAFKITKSADVNYVSSVVSAKVRNLCSAHFLLFTVGKKKNTCSKPKQQELGRL